ncbi:unnamed protein product (macronuclear) [Paramecium tetraurelia]|uniref:Uncharacterized protein n=1 Tax=Paramecium tetraurelia TaxID=5888 RepID=A0DXA7_PARTE|nr:uncharacterized protein GSPATT00021306001 [Paramecium tetraurelia]CAK87674.1 unnamed protein product [Paramecium tetraurelia]|eukprot:XP_001455071.1 hypothetical protein (macronuclear) [Paramecium tetraurelia strain d4-2]
MDTNTIQSVYIPDPEEKIVYKNVRKPNLPATADIAYCEIRIAELMAEVEAQKEHSFKIQQQLDLYVTYEQSLIQYESKNTILSEENKQLSCLLQVKSRDLEQAQLKILELEQQIDSLREVDQELHRNIQLLLFKDREIQELNNKYNSLEQFLQQNKNWELINQDLKNQIINWKHDVELWKERFTKSENERKRLLELREEGLKKYDLLENVDTQPQSPQVELNEQQTEKQKVEKNPENHSQLLQQTQVNLFEKEHQNTLLNNELNGLRQQQQEFQKRLSELTNQLGKLDEKDKEIVRLNGLLQEKPKLQIVKEEKIVIVENSALDEEKIRLQGLLDESNIRLEHSFNEIEQLNSKIQTLEDVNQKLQRDNRQIQRLQEQIDLLVIDKQNLQTSNGQKDKVLNETLALLRQKTLEIQELQAVRQELTIANERVHTLIKDLEQCRRQLGELEQLTQLVKKQEHICQEKEKLVKEQALQIQQLKQNRNELQNELNDSKIRINLLSKYEARVKSQQSTIQSLRQELQETLGGSEQWREKYNQNCSEISRLQRLLDVSQQRIIKLQEELKNFNNNFELGQIKIEGAPVIKRIEKVVIQDNKQIEKLQNQLISQELNNESLLRNRKFEIQTTQRELDALNQLLQQKRQESELWKNKYLTSEQQNTQLQNINDKYKQLVLRCEGQKATIQQLENKSLEQGQEIEQQRSKIFSLTLEVHQIEGYKIEKEQQKEKALQLYQELILSQSRVARLIGAFNELNRQKSIKSDNPQAKFVQQKSDTVEKMRQKIVELEMEIDDTKDDQISELEQRIQILESELKKQLDINGQLVKDLQNVDRKKQDILSELQALQTSESDTNQLRIAFNKKVKECEQLKTDLDKIQIVIQSYEQQIEKSREQDANQKNELQRLKIFNNNLNKQIASLLLHLNSLELTINTQRHKLDSYPEFEERINDQIGKINSLEKDNNELKLQNDILNAQISQLEQNIIKLQPLEQQVTLLREIINNDNREISLWQTRFQDLENERSQQNEDYRKKIDQFKIELKDQQNLEMIIKQQQNDIEDLTQNNQKLVANIRELQTQQDKLLRDLDNKDIDIKRLQQIEQEFRKLQELFYQEIEKYQDLSDKHQQLQNQYDQTRREQEKLENKCAMMSSEIERLKVMLKNKNQELELNKQQIHQNEQLIDQLQPLTVENKRLFEQIQKQIQQIDELKQQIIQLQRQLEDKKKQLNQEQINQEQQQEEINRLLNVLRSKEDDIHQYRQVTKQYEIQLKDNKKEDDQWNDLQNELNKLTQHVNYLNEVIGQKNIELENMQKQNTQYQLQLLENEKLDYKILEKTVEAREKEVEDWRRRFQKLTQDQEKLYNEKLESNNKLAGQELEIERWKRKVTSNESELNLLRNIISQLNVEIERLSKSSEDLLQDNEGWREKYSKLQQQIPSMLELIPPITPGNSFRISEKPQQ